MSTLNSRRISVKKFSFFLMLITRLSFPAGAINMLIFHHSTADYYLGGKVRVDGINLEQLTRELSLTPLQGEMTADFGTVEYRNRRLQSDGDMRINIFAGEVFICNLSTTDIFSSYRSFAADIDLNGINLGQMTRTFEFGEINGTIDGYIHNMRLFGSTPSAFVAEISTREQG